jgi:hypothetical protein
VCCGRTREELEARDGIEPPNKALQASPWPFGIRALPYKLHSRQPSV